MLIDGRRTTDNEPENLKKTKKKNTKQRSLDPCSWCILPLENEKENDNVFVAVHLFQSYSNSAQIRELSANLATLPLTVDVVSFIFP